MLVARYTILRNGIGTEELYFVKIKITNLFTATGAEAILESLLLYNHVSDIISK